MTALLAPFGLAGHGANAKGKANRASLLSSAEAPEQRRAAAARAIADELSESDPAAAANFATHAEAAIRDKAPLNIGEDLLQPYQAPTPAAQPEALTQAPLVPDVDPATALAEQKPVMQAQQDADQLYAERDQEKIGRASWRERGWKSV